MPYNPGPKKLTVERPTLSAIVDFLSEDAIVTIEIDPKARQLNLKVQVSDGEGSSTWRKAEFSFPLNP